MVQTKIFAASKAAPTNSDRYTPTRVPLKKKARTGILPDQKNKGKKIPNHSGAWNYCVMYKKCGMPEHKWKLHSSKNCFGKRSDQAPVKEVLGGNL